VPTHHKVIVEAWPIIPW